MKSRSSRLEMRLTDEHKSLLEQAAALQGQPLSAFAASTLIERARDILSKHQVTELGRRDMETFMKLLDDAPSPNAVLRRAALRLKALRD